MAVAVSFTDVWTDGKRLHAIGKLTFSGNYAAGGDAVDIKAAAANSAGQSWRSTQDPELVQVQGKAGFVYEYDKSNKRVLVRGQEPTNATAGVIALSQIATAAYPAGVTGDTVEFYAIGKKLI